MGAETNVISWNNAGENDILWEYNQEYIRTASVLVVNDWQWAVFIRDGQILATFEAGHNRRSSRILRLHQGRREIHQDIRDSNYHHDVHCPYHQASIALLT